MPTDLMDSLAPVRAAVAVASDLCLRVGEEGTRRIDKVGREPVTIADFGSQAVLLRTIAEAYPTDRVLAEERSEVLLAEGPESVAAVTEAVSRALGEACSAETVLGWIDYRGGDGPRTWAVDPIDGTKGFLRGDQFAVAAGLVVADRAVAGVLGCPRFEGGGVIAWGGPGAGAYLDDDGGRMAATVSAESDLRSARILGSVESAHGDPELLRRMVDELQIGGGWVRIDSQAKYVGVAAGIAEIYVRPRNHPDWRERIWDHAAGAAIVEGAGGRVTDLDGRDLDFALGSRLEENRGVLASSGVMHDTLLDFLRES